MPVGFRVLRWFRAALAAGALSGLIESVSAAGPFESTQVRALVTKYCFECHDSDTRKGDLDLQKLPLQLGDPAVFAQWVRVLDRVEAGEMPPPKQDQPTSAERAGALASLANGLRGTDLARQAAHGRVVFRRLNRTEYENSVQDLLSLPNLKLADRLPPDAESDGFDNVGAALNTSPVQLARYLEAAGVALREAMAMGPRPKVQLRAVKASEFRLWTNAYGQAQVSGTNVVFLRQALDHVWPMPTVVSRVAGEYRLRLRGFGTTWNDRQLDPPDRQHVARLYSGNRLVGTFDLNNGVPGEVEFKIWVNRGDQMVIEFPTLDAREAMAHLLKRGKPYRGAGVALDLVESEGPLMGEWPPASYRALFDRLPSELWKAKDPMAKPPALVNPTGAHHNNRFYVVTKDAPAEARRLLRRFMEQAFRRPIVPGEEDPYVELVKPLLQGKLAFQEALLPGFQAVLCAPDFLFLNESPGRLDDWALAARLSYFLWKTTPDEELRRLAAAGQLRNPDVLVAQADRLLDDPRSRNFTDSFLGQWLDLRKITFTQPDSKLYPDFDSWLQDSMLAESFLFFEELLGRDLSVENFVKSDFTFVNQRLAQLYGIPGVTGSAMRRITLPPDSPRGGFLSQAAVLKVTANGSTTSPVIRGAWVRARLLGQSVPPPPPTAGSIDPDTRGTTTIREQLDKHRHDPSCASCHTKIDPPGFALESFDVRGAWRDQYRSLETGDSVDLKINNQPVAFKLGRAVDASGRTEEGRAFQNFFEFRELLRTQHNTLARGFVEKLVVFATGAPIQFADRAEVDAVLQRAKAKNYGIRSLLHEVIRSPLFLQK